MKWRTLLKGKKKWLWSIHPKADGRAMKENARRRKKVMMTQTNKEDLRLILGPDSWKLFPMTILMSRYSGAYEGGRFLAFNCEPWEIPRKVYGSDVSCSDFFENTNIIIGRGDTPNEAVQDLDRRKI